jgi:hypothetical protein
MGTRRSLRLAAAALAALLTLGAVAQAGLVPANLDIVRGTVAAYDAQTGKLLVAGRTLYVTAQSVVQRRVEGRFEPASRAQLTAGQDVRVAVRLESGRYLARQVDIIEKGESRRSAK